MTKLHPVYWIIFIIVLIGVIILPRMIGNRIADKLNKKFAEQLRQAIGNDALTLYTIYKKPYAAGVVADHVVIATLIPKQLGDAGTTVTQVGRLTDDSDTLIRIKLNGTDQSALYLGVLADEADTSVRTMTGWKQPEPGFSLNHSPKSTLADSEAAFARLQPATKQALRDVRQQYGAFSVVPAATLFALVGEKHAQTLVQAKPETITAAEIVVRLPAGQTINQALQDLQPAITLLETDLAGK